MAGRPRVGGGEVLVLAVASNGKALWYLTRGTGLVTLILLTLSVALGVAEANRWASPRWPRFVTAALHKNVSLIAVVFLALHIVTSVVDAFAPIHWLDVVIPFTSPYRPVWLGLGAVATDLLIALVVTSVLRTRVGYPAWRVIHWTAYACWPVAVLHSLGTGTDTRRGWALLLYAACFAVVLAAVWWRLASGWSPEAARARAIAAVGSIATPLAIAGFVVVGPLRHGWAARAGTPASLLGSATAASSTASTSPAAAGSLTVPFAATASGTIDAQGPDSAGNETVTLALTLSGGATGVLHIVLQGPASGSGGVQMASSNV
ncbi:MAG TPA: ferric reductase-like transmembrane domain-containing protein, partial [Acidimicrobiales bacterium]